MKKFFAPSHHYRKTKTLFNFSYFYCKLKKIFSFSTITNLFFLILLTVCFGLGIILLLPETALPASSKYIFSRKWSDNASPLVILDAGHGGRDPGKVGSLGTLEKEINLKIALYLRTLLESQDIRVIMTREEDIDLADVTTNFKISDMKKRIDIVQQSNADLVISIHQNSYSDADIHGAQCFYYSNSEAGKELADILQKQIIISTKQTKTREIKSNNDYYLLKHSPLPTVIVECGFLSNPEEEQLLSDKNYQKKMAWAIHLGILKYLNT